MKLKYLLMYCLYKREDIRSNLALEAHRASSFPGTRQIRRPELSLASYAPCEQNESILTEIFNMSANVSPMPGLKRLVIK